MKALLALIPIIIVVLTLLGKHKLVIHGGLIAHKVYRHFKGVRREDERI